MSYPDSDTERALPVEDDWFAAPEKDMGVPYDEASSDSWDEPEELDEPRPRPSPGDNRPVLIGAGIVAVIVLIIVGVVLARALSGSDGDGAVTTPTTPTITTATEPVTTPPPPATTTEPVTPPPATPPPAAATLPTDVTLRPGDTGEGVTAVQEALTSLGYDPGPADGDYGPATQAAVIAFQQAAGITADGVVGPETLGALSEALNVG